MVQEHTVAPDGIRTIHLQIFPFVNPQIETLVTVYGKCAVAYSII